MLIHIGEYGSCFVSFTAAPNTINLPHRNPSFAGTFRERCHAHESYKRRYVTRKNYVIEICKGLGSKAPHIHHQMCNSQFQVRWSVLEHDVVYVGRSTVVIIRMHPSISFSGYK